MTGMRARRICMLMLMLFIGIARAEGADGFWTNHADLYYHACQYCGDGDGRVPISETAARAFAKFPCPICVQAEDAGEDVQAASRGGTIVVKFSDAWLDAQELTDVFGWHADSDYTGRAAWQMLGECLHGEKYGAFVEECLESGSAEARANTPYILSRGALVMSRRHIGGDWYIIVRPEEKFRDEWSMYWRVSSLKLSMESEVLTSSFDMQTVEETRRLSLARLDGESAAFSCAGDGFVLEVYEALDGCIAVIREEGGASGSMDNARLMIDGATGGIDLVGYAEGTDAVYCFALDAGELEALRGNARVQLWHVEQISAACFRVDAGEAYDYYSEATGEVLFSLEKVNGCDTLNADFCLSDSSVERFALWRADESVLLGLDGQIYRVEDAEGNSAERLTPLIWQDGHGLFLAEMHKYADYAPEDKLSPSGVEFGVRYGSGMEEEWGSYLCWLVDENGHAVSGLKNRAFTIYGNGEIHMEDLQGNITKYTLAGPLSPAE